MRTIKDKEEELKQPKTSFKNPFAQTEELRQAQIELSSNKVQAIKAQTQEVETQTEVKEEEKVAEKTNISSVIPGFVVIESNDFKCSICFDFPKIQNFGSFTCCEKPVCKDCFIQNQATRRGASTICPF